MASIFTKIINGELPGHFVWRDDVCVSILTIEPFQAGHLLVIPRDEVAHWIDCDPAVWAHVQGVAATLGQAIQQAYQPKRVGMMVVGLEVAHVHVHLMPIGSIHDMEIANARKNVPADELAAEAEKIRAALRSAGHAEVAEA